ncbi:hypothetical protein [Sinomonas sp. G460-2]|uniref:hypothetical protein n=1 Tax=Sinomonas sp. G460-2 TaxID=3393464 RepID=UPI0039EE0BA7
MPPNPLGRALRHRRAGHDKLVWERPDLRAPEDFALDDALRAMTGHVIVRARLDGTYEIR